MVGASETARDLAKPIWTRASASCAITYDYHEPGKVYGTQEFSPIRIGDTVVGGGALREGTSNASDVWVKNQKGRRRHCRRGNLKE